MPQTLFSLGIHSDVTRNFEGLVINGVELLNRELRWGAYGRVFAVKYCGMTCAAKEVHSDLVEGQRIVDMFLKECHQCSKLRHPNIIQFLGVLSSGRCKEGSAATNNGNDGGKLDVICRETTKHSC